MSATVAVGNVYNVQTDSSKPPHYYAILEDPHVTDGTFITASFTDAGRNSRVTDIRPAFHEVCPQWSLAKSSKVAMAYVVVKDAVWLSRLGAIYIGRANQATIDRTRCNLHWFRDQLNPTERTRPNYHLQGWAKPCPPCPQNPPAVP